VNGAFFYLISQLSYPALFGVVADMPNEFPIIVREHHSGMYSVVVYYISRVFSYLPVFPVDGTCTGHAHTYARARSGIMMVIIAYYMIGLRPDILAFAGSLLVCIVLEITAVAMGLMFGACSPSYPVALATAGPLLTVLSLTGTLAFVLLLSAFVVHRRTVRQLGCITSVDIVDAMGIILPIRIRSI
jgi:hypothetical protein